MLTSVIVGNPHFLVQFISLSKVLAFAWLDEWIFLEMLNLEEL